MAASHGQTARGLSEIVLGAFPLLLFIPPSSFSHLKRYSLQSHCRGSGGHEHANSPRGPRKGTAQGPAVNAPGSAAPAQGGRAPSSRSQITLSQLPLAVHSRSSFSQLPLPAPSPSLWQTCSQSQAAASPAAELPIRHARPLLWRAADRACRSGVRALTVSTHTPGSLDADQEPQNCISDSIKGEFVNKSRGGI